MGIIIGFPIQLGCILPICKSQEPLLPNDLQWNISIWWSGSNQGKEKSSRYCIMMKWISTDSEQSGWQPTPPIHRRNMDKRQDSPSLLGKEQGSDQHHQRIHIPGHEHELVTCGVPEIQNNQEKCTESTVCCKVK